MALSGTINYLSNPMLSWDSPEIRERLIQNDPNLLKLIKDQYNLFNYVGNLPQGATPQFGLSQTYNPPGVYNTNLTFPQGPYPQAGGSGAQTSPTSSTPAQLSPYEQTLQNILKLLSGGTVNTQTLSSGPQSYAYQLDQLNPFYYHTLTGLGLPEQKPAYSSLGGVDNLYNLLGGR